MLLHVPGQVDVEALVLRVLLDLRDGPVGVPVGRVVQPGQQLGGGGAVVVPEVQVAGVLPGALFPEAAGVEPVLVLLHRVQVSDVRVEGAVDGHVVRGEVREVAFADEVPGDESG